MCSLDSLELNCECSTNDSNLNIINDISTNSFNLQWTFGLNSNVPVISLGTKNRSLVAYACAHVTILYYYKSREMFTLQGHSDYVRTLSVDQTGKLLLTADFGKDSTVVVWDTEKRIPICTLFNPHGQNGMTAASLSPNAKYIITVGNENVQLVKLWLWTFGTEEPDAVAELIEMKGSCRVKDISFSYENSNLLAFTTDLYVLFITWNQNDKKLSINYPLILSKPSNLGIINNTSFISGNTKAFTGTANGYVLVWDVSIENDSQDVHRMEHIKSIHLQKANITKIVNYMSMVVTGNSLGDINFYDSDLKILYWCRNCELDSITSISFNFQSKFKRKNDDLLDECETDKVSNGNEEFEEIKEQCNDISSNITRKLEYQPKLKGDIIKSIDDKSLKFKKKFDKFQVPRDATLQSNAFCINKFIVATSAGKLMWVDVSTLTCGLISNYFESPLKTFDVHPQSNYLVTADNKGTLFLFNYTNHQLMFKKDIPLLPKLLPILKTEIYNGRIVHVTNTDANVNQNSYSTVLKYSPTGDVLVCAMQNGVMWILHPDTLDPLDPLPFKHSSQAILEIVFSECSNFIAYYDDAMTVAVFKLNENFKKESSKCYDFIGKYRSHNLSIVSILFSPSLHEDKTIPRFLSLGQDQDLIEYDLAKSGPYPDPGLLILQINRIEKIEMPLCMISYPQFGKEKFFAISNSDYKFKLIDAIKKETRATVLGPTFSLPVQKMMVCKTNETENASYIVFATNKEIGLQLLPFDGNPYKIVGMVGYPQKISWMRINGNGRILFTLGCDDRCILMWEINYKSVTVMHRLGGKQLSPFYGLISGGKQGWLFNELQDLFIYAQILQQGENSMKKREISDEVSIEQLPNLIRAIGFYPLNDQLEDLINEVIYRSYASTGEINTKINFEELVKLYINHRPTSGVSMKQIQNAFNILGKQDCSEDFSMSEKQFIDALYGRAFNSSKNLKKNLLSMQEFQTYLKYLIFRNPTEELSEYNTIEESIEQILKCLPSVSIGAYYWRISYKDFATNVMGIESPKETRADNNEK